MSWTIDYNHTLGIIEIVYVGFTSRLDIQEVTSKAIAMTEKEETLDVLIDAVEMDPAPSVIDIYKLPAEQYVSEGLSHQIRIALVEPNLPQAKEAARFYETVCVNRGWSVQLFSHRDEAIIWLTARARPHQNLSQN